MDLKEQNAIDGDPMRHWYYVAKHRAIRSLIGRRQFDRALDVGAGSGVFSRLLLADGAIRHATCVDPNYADDWVGQRRSDRIAFRKSVDEVDADLVLMIDVIEHVDDDVGLIADYARRARSGARFVISVPAFSFLWSGHDEFLEHRRRYTLGQLNSVAARAGLDVIESRYFFGMILPAVAALRLADRALKGDKPATGSALKAAPRWLNGALIAVHEIERTALFPVNRVAGVTAFCLAEKRDAAWAAAAA